MRKSITAVALVAGLAMSAGAYGQTWVEQGDAGDLPGNAQMPEGSGSLTEIQGNISADADMYLISIVNPGGFEATTVGLASIDTQLFLFDENGMGVTHDDDDPQGGGLQSRITGIFVPGPGLYYLAISTYNNDPTSNSGLIWNSTPFGEERSPDGPGAGSAVSSWDGGGTSGGYGIALRGVEFPGSNCPADCNEDGSLNTLDFLCFLNAFNNGDPYADYNGDGTTNTLDFLAYLNDYNAGCE